MPTLAQRAIWELLVIDAVAQLCTPQYEKPIGDGNPKSPDIHLPIPRDHGFWIESAYLYGRSIGNDRRLRTVVQRFYYEANQRKIPLSALQWRADGQACESGYVRKLPHLHEVNKFFRHSDIQQFFSQIIANPNRPLTCNLQPEYTVVFHYQPTTAGAFTYGGGLLEEVPRVVEEHAVYRTLREKAKRHRGVSKPYVVCIGSDRSPALTIGSAAAGTIGLREAIQVAFTLYPKLSAVITVSIKTVKAPIRDRDRQAYVTVQRNSAAKYPLLPDQERFLSELDFNRWRCSEPHDPWKPQAGNSKQGSRRHSGGTVVYSQLSNGIFSVEIPSPLLVDALAGRLKLADHLQLSPDDQLRHVLEQGWEIFRVSMVPGNIQDGESPKVKLEFTPFRSVF
jgi:hypothetical protein